MYCSCCGNKKHCGAKIYKEHRCYQDIRRGELCVCESCECKNCVLKEKDNG
jgi:hypothetical protein